MIESDGPEDGETAAKSVSLFRSFKCLLKRRPDVSTSVPDNRYTPVVRGMEVSFRLVFALKNAT